MAESTKGRDVIDAPFTDAQVRALNQFQFSEVMHPFTCPEQGKPLKAMLDYGREVEEREHGEVVLIATAEGWKCPMRGCGYTQGWAHKFMAQPGFVDQMQNYLRDVSEGRLHERSD